MAKYLKSRTPILAIILSLLAIGYTFAANKVVVVPMGGDSVAGTNGQLQYNDEGKLAGAPIIYGKTRGELSFVSGADYLILGFSGPEYDTPFYISYYDVSDPGGRAVMIIEKTATTLTDTVKFEGLIKLRSYSSAPVSCTTSTRGTIVMNNNYEPCVCKPHLLGSAFRLVRDINLNCWS